MEKRERLVALLGVEFFDGTGKGEQNDDPSGNVSRTCSKIKNKKGETKR